MTCFSFLTIQGSEKSPSTLAQEPLKYGLLSVENNKESSITSWKTHDPNSIIILKDPTSVAMESEVISPKPLLMNRQLNQPHLEGGGKERKRVKSNGQFTFR